jgi:hypothetical protein
MDLNYWTASYQDLTDNPICFSKISSYCFALEFLFALPVLLF